MGLSLPKKKQAWQQVVQAKIRNQAANFSAGSAESASVARFVKMVRSGDVSNVEAQAARRYWSVIGDKKFRRLQQTRNGINGALDFGYAIVRALTARAIVSAGLHPAIALHHSNRVNPFALADDLMEPLRPFVDEIVLGGNFEYTDELNPTSKASLLAVLQLEVEYRERSGPLTEAVDHYVLGYKRFVFAECDRIEFPARGSCGIDQ